jgi:dihydroorotate dehydrogenase electron transfer subunit
MTCTHTPEPVSANRLEILPPDLGARLRRPVCLQAEVVRNERLSDRYWLLRLAAEDVAQTARPGQFVMLTPSRAAGQGPTLPRPMAVAGVDVRRGTLDIVYGVVGAGTLQMTTFAPGETMTTVGPLGRGFVPPEAPGRALLLGRGIGSCSLTLLATELTASGWDVVAVASARSAQAQIGPQLYRRTAATLICVDDDAGDSEVEHLSRRLEGLFDVAGQPSFVAACGSHRLELMAEHVGRRYRVPVQVSVEAHMACGLGYCHGCASAATAVTTESPLVCVDGPVFALTGTPLARADSRRD